MAMSDQTSMIDTATEEGRKEERKYFLDMLEQGLSVEEIKRRLMETGADTRQ